MDNYGCWITDQDSARIYLMFWSESARQYFKGDSTPPYKDVVARAESARLGLMCGNPVIAPADTLESICAAYSSYMINTCKGDPQGWAYEGCIQYYGANGGLAQAKADYEAQVAAGCSVPN